MKTSVILVTLGLLATRLFAYDWPAADLQVIRSFGQEFSGETLPGVEVETLAPSLMAPDEGDTVFVYRPDVQTIQNLPSSLGGFISLAHEDNLRTVTTRIVPDAGVDKRHYRKGEPLGPVEVQPGASESRHRLFVFDQQLGEVVNPLLVFPPLPDNRSPLFLDVKATAEGAKSSVSLFSQGSLPVGYWNLQVLVADPFTLFPAVGKEKGQESQRGVYAVEAYLNGTEVFNAVLDSLQEKDGHWQIKGLSLDWNAVIADDQAWNLGQVFVNQGTNILEVSVRDFTGNQSGKTFRIMGTR